VRNASFLLKIDRAGPAEMTQIFGPFTILYHLYKFIKVIIDKNYSGSEHGDSKKIGRRRWIGVAIWRKGAATIRLVRDIALVIARCAIKMKDKGCCFSRRMAFGTWLAIFVSFPLFSTTRRLFRHTTSEDNDKESLGFSPKPKLHVSLSSNLLNCGCPITCDDTALAKRISGLPFTCKERINYLVTRDGVSQSDACSAAAQENACGSECDPDHCNNNATISFVDASKSPADMKSINKENNVQQKSKAQDVQSKYESTNVKGNQENATEDRPKVSLPIFVASLPKSGTGSIAGFLECGGIPTAHYRVHPGRPRSLLGRCVERNVVAGKNVWHNCGDYLAYSDTAYAMFSEPYRCFFPSIQALDTMYQQYPNSTILLTVRNTAEWYTSFHNWYNGSLENAWRHCNAPGFPGENATAKDFFKFYEWHTEHVRSFAATHPSMKYVEVGLEAADTADILERELGISSKCWHHLHKSGHTKNKE